MNKITFLGLILGVFLICVGTVSANEELVVNGGFEQPTVVKTLPNEALSGTSLNGWSITSATSKSDGTIDLVSTLWQPHSGSQSIDLSGNYPSQISQTINTVDNDGSYTMTFWMSGNAYKGPECQDVPVKQLAVYWDGVKLDNPYTFDTSGTSFENMGWVQVTISGLKATKPTTEIAFKDIGPDNPCGVALDDISVVDPPVTPAPEFPTLTFPVAMMIGFIGVILYIRKLQEN